MSKRYGTLDVSLNMSQRSRSNPYKLNKTLEAYDEDESQKPSDEKVNKFRQLYYKNERLRKELKLLNQKLNEKLDKLKLPAVKHKAMSVDLNRSPPSKPSKALARQLQNGYKQIAMYKKQVESLKGKQQSPQNYSKLRSAEDMITFMDMEINSVQEQLKSEKNVKKIQDKVLAEDVDNAQIKQRLKQYEKQIKGYRDKIKELQVKSRKREKQFKKQQAYSVSLKQKVRKFRAEEQELQKEAEKPPLQIQPHEFNVVKQELILAKGQYESTCKKIQAYRKKIKDCKNNKTIYDQDFLGKEALLKTLQVQVESYRRLLKDLQTKKYQQSGIKLQQRSKWAAKDLTQNTILKLQQIEDDVEESPVTNNKNRQSSHNQSFLSKNATSTLRDERNWKGKMKKVSMGYTMPTDQTFTENGLLLGLKTYFDQNRYIVGLAPIMLVQQSRSECSIQGDVTNIEIKWEVEAGDHIAEIYGSFTEQGYLAQIILKTWRGITGTFGFPQDDKFHFRVQYGQYFSGMFGGYRRLGQDIRFTEIGFWILKA